jgi:alpha-mannosidase
MLASLLVVGASSTRSSVYTFHRREESTVEVGQGNLKLTFSTDQGKMINYVNGRSLVCNGPGSFMITYY